MPAFRPITVLILCALVGSVGLYAQSDAAKAYDKLKKEIDGIAKDTSKYGSDLKSTMASLSKLSAVNDKNTPKAVKSFRGDVEKLGKNLRNVREGIKNLREKRATYFADWERSLATISNPELKQASEERRRTVMDAHGRLTEEATALNQRVDAFMKELSDLSTFLASDPTGGAVGSAKPTIDKAITEGNALATDVLGVATRLSGFAKGAS